MNDETVVMKDLTIAFYKEHFEKPVTKYMHDVHRVMVAHGFSLERAIVHQFEYMCHDLLEDAVVLANIAHAPTTRDSSGLFIGGNTEERELLPRTAAGEGFGYLGRELK